MKTSLLALTVVISCACAGNALALTKTEYNTQKDQIRADYKVNRDKCGPMKGNAKDVCVLEAKGAQKVAKAELEMQYKPSAKNTREVNVAKADSAYKIAKEKCDDLAGNAKDVCVKDAKAGYVKAKEDVKIAKAAMDGGANKSEKVKEAKKDASEETREANYKAARERCDGLAGNAKDVCQKTAKANFAK